MGLKICSLATILLAIGAYYYQEQIYYLYKSIKEVYLTKSNPLEGLEIFAEKLLTVDELKQYNGVDSDLLYLSVLGKVYDVTEGKKHYGPSSNYHIFIGRDASKAFITGEFSDTGKDLDDVLMLEPSDLLDLKNWANVYEKKYIYIGKLIGRYYDSSGKPTAYNIMVKSKLREAAQLKFKKDEESLRYPPCNAEWDATLGSRVWCTKKSGGIEREWEGVPRMLYTTESTESRCVCVRSEDENNARLKEYEKCDPSSLSCYVTGTAANS